MSVSKAGSVYNDAEPSQGSSQTASTQNVAPGQLVVWQPAPANWVKVNTDGASKGNPGLAACGGAFRSSHTYILGFSLGLGFHTANYAELMGVFQAANIAEKEGFKNLWIETDSTNIKKGIQMKHIDAPPGLKHHWNNFLRQMNDMSIECSHIFREGNTVADKLANLGYDLEPEKLQLWFTPPQEIEELLSRDARGIPNVRNS